MREPNEAAIQRANVRRMATESFNRRLRNSGVTDRLLIETLTEAFELGFKEAQLTYSE